MPQGPLQVSASVKPNGSGKSGAPMQLDAAGALLTGKGNNTALNITAEAATVVDAAARRICKVIVNTAASAAGGIYDSGTTGNVNAAHLVFAIPQTAGIYDVDMPLSAGLAIIVGTGGVVSLSYQK